MPSHRPDVTAVVVSYRTAADTTALVARLGGGVRFPTIVVDNSGDLPEVAGVTIIRPGRNLGFAAAANAGVAASATGWVAVANPDTDLDDHAVRALLRAAAERPDVGIIAPRLIYPDGRPQINGGAYSGWPRELARSFRVGRLLRPLRGRLRAEQLSPAAGLIDRDWVSGAAMVVRAAAWRAVGGLDERFFMYFEDEDLCRRVKAKGWACVVEPSVVVRHTIGGSVEHDPYGTAEYQRSRVRYHEKHSSRLLAGFVRWSSARLLRQAQ